MSCVMVYSCSGLGDQRSRPSPGGGDPDVALGLSRREAKLASMRVFILRDDARTLVIPSLCTSRCRMYPPTLPVAPSNIAVYSTFASAADSNCMAEV